MALTTSFKWVQKIALLISTVVAMKTSKWEFRDHRRRGGLYGRRAGPGPNDHRF